MAVQDYVSRFCDGDTPGWDAITAELSRVYPGVAPRHYATLVKYACGGNDPLDGFDIYDHQAFVFHRHLISYGMSELYYSPESSGGEFSRFGFEFTMRVRLCFEDNDVENADGTIIKHEPVWAMNLMNNLARYVYDSGKCFDVYHFIPTNSPIKMGGSTRLVGIMFVPDTQLSPLNTVHGKVQFLQMVGITQREIDWLRQDPKRKRVEELCQKIQTDNPLLITDLKRTKDYVQER